MRPLVLPSFRSRGRHAEALPAAAPTEEIRTVTIVDDATQVWDVPKTWTGPLPVVKPEPLPPLPGRTEGRYGMPELTLGDLARLRAAMERERPAPRHARPEPGPVVDASTAFRRDVSAGLRRDYARLPVFREVAKGKLRLLATRRPSATTSGGDA